MKIFFLFLFTFSFKSYAQTDKGNLFSKEEMEHPLEVKELDLSHKSLRQLPALLSAFKNLAEIDLSENPDLDLSASFELLSRLQNLRSLSLTNLYKPIPANISLLVWLEELDIEKNDLTSIPEGVKKLNRLRSLNLWGNKISQINLQPGDLPNLKEIELGLNKLNIFPGRLSFLPLLKKISVYKNSISQVLPGIKKFHRLEELVMRGNKISSLPEEFGTLMSLRRLDLLENELSSMGPLLNLKGLEVLKIGDNKIEAIPGKIGRLTNLKELSLSNNPIRILPEQISELRSLTDLSINGNDSVKLPAYLSIVARLPGLKTLGITMSGVKVMPPEFEKLSQVNSFSIWDCDLTRAERRRLKALFPMATFSFEKSWGDKSFYKTKLCSMNENEWDSISVNNATFRYLLVGQNYKYTDDDGIHHWCGEIVLNADKKAVSKEKVEKILLAIADRLEMEEISAARTCRTFEIIHAAMPAKEEEVKKYYEENFIGIYYRKSGLLSE